MACSTPYRPPDPTEEITVTAPTAGGTISAITTSLPPSSPELIEKKRPLACSSLPPSRKQPQPTSRPKACSTPYRPDRLKKVEKKRKLACSSPPPSDFELPEKNPDLSSLPSSSAIPSSSSSSPSLGLNEMESVSLSIDLIPVAKHLFRFLKAVDRIPRDPLKNLMSFALHRYNKWLDFVNWCIETNQNDDFHAPFDIEVVWVAHVIRTDEYKADCLKLFGREIPHSFDHRSGVHSSVTETTRRLWKERTGSDLVMNTEKFFNLSQVFASNLQSGVISDQNKTSITVCLLIEDMKWFHDFRRLYPRDLLSLLSDEGEEDSEEEDEEEEIRKNLKKEHGVTVTPLDFEVSQDDARFLEEGRQDYIKFLKLQKKFNFCPDPNSLEGAGKICATYKIDLFWHSHMLNTREYRQDCDAYLGDIVSHAPWPTEAAEILDEKFGFTEQVWKREFGEEYQSQRP